MGAHASRALASHLASPKNRAPRLRAIPTMHRCNKLPTYYGNALLRESVLFLFHQQCFSKYIRVISLFIDQMLQWSFVICWNIVLYAMEQRPIFEKKIRRLICRRLKLYPLPTKPASPHCPTDHGTQQPPPPQLLRAAASHPTIAQPSPSAAHTAAPGEWLDGTCAVCFLSIWVKILFFDWFVRFDGRWTLLDSPLLPKFTCDRCSWYSRMIRKMFGSRFPIAAKL